LPLAYDLFTQPGLVYTLAFFARPVAVNLANATGKNWI